MVRSVSVARRLAGPVLALGLAAALAACTHVPARTIWALRSFDPLTTDPARLRAAVAMPQEAFPAHGGAKLVISQVRRGGGDEEKIEIQLEEVPLASETGLGAVKPKPGQTARAYRIPPAEIPRLLEARQRAAARAAKEPGAFAGTLSVGVDGCRPEGAPSPKAFHVSTWLKTAETGEYLTVLDDVDLVKLVGAEKLAAEAKVCEAK
ncbi:hypothetical protein [Pinisolibacter aquiterrae]|uniref:hypothetical protein n=1 Tax=Pinisolibacter aquiterrae TaxID=2815579 RepID=UPI001C3C47E1|nr:hypothetical protein [Pinisolibacter aquiterrae]MBV5265297.1 hypothetical protein [Pinisolibacter aquiterrae]MCC8235375.1 hypothetical protein [Pinisolibacter aquiterrae]